MATWVDPFIGGMASLLGTGLGYLNQQSTNKLNAQINRESLEASKAMQNDAFAFQREMMHELMAYNSPMNQASMYRSAGMNPYAMMGENSFVPATVPTASSGGSVPGSLPMQSYQPNFDGVADAVHGYYDTRIKQEQTDMLKYQNEVKENEYFMKTAQQYAELRAKDNKSDIDRMLLRKYESELRVALASEDYKIKQNRHDAELAATEVETANYNLNYQRMTEKIRTELMRQDIRLSKAQQSELYSRISLVNQQIENLVKEGELTDEQAYQVRQMVQIRTPDQIRAVDEVNEYRQPLVNKVKKFVDRFNRFISGPITSVLRGLK